MAHYLTGRPRAIWLLGLSAFVYAIGVFLHFAVDMQKHTALALRPGELITAGLFSWHA